MVQNKNISTCLNRPSILKSPKSQDWCRNHYPHSFSSEPPMFPCVYHFFDASLNRVGEGRLEQRFDELVKASCLGVPGQSFWLTMDGTGLFASIHIPWTLQEISY